MTATNRLSCLLSAGFEGCLLSSTMKSFRRWTLIVLCALLAGIVVRLRSKGESPPTTGGWRELEGPDFR